MMRKIPHMHEDKLIWEIANTRISYADFRSKYYDGDSSRFKKAYINLYNHGLVTEKGQMMKLSKAGSDVYLYEDFKKHINKSSGYREGIPKSMDSLNIYLPHILVILLILCVLIAFTLYL